MISITDLLSDKDIDPSSSARNLTLRASQTSNVPSPVLLPEVLDDTDGFSLLLAAAEYQNASSFQHLSPPATPPRKTASEVPTKCIIVTGNHNDTVSIGYGSSYTFSLGPPSQTRANQYISIQWSDTYRAFELRIIGPGRVIVGFNTFTQFGSPALLETMTRFCYQGQEFCFQKPSEPRPRLPSADQRTANDVHLRWQQTSSHPPRSPWLHPTGSVAADGLGQLCSLGLQASLKLVSGRHSSHGPFRPRSVTEGQQMVAPYPKMGTSAIQSAPSTPAGSATRPHISWANLIIDAFKSSGQQFLLVSEIYSMIISTHAYFAARQSLKKWKNSVRHALSVNTCFFRLNENEYKCGLWGYHEKTGPTTCRKGKRYTRTTDGLTSPVSSPETEESGFRFFPVETGIELAGEAGTAMGSPMLPLPEPARKTEERILSQISARHLDFDMKQRLDIGCATF